MIKNLVKTFIDVETGGFDSKTNGLIQVAGIIEVNGSVKEEFNFQMQPLKGRKYDTQALVKNGYDMAMIKKFNPNAMCFGMFRQMMKKYIDPFDNKDKSFFIAYNSDFDEQFIRQWFKDNKDDYFGSLFWNPSICVMKKACEFLIEHRDEFTNFRLETVANFFDLKPEGNLHDAMVDIKLTKELYHMLNDPEKQMELF